MRLIFLMAALSFFLASCSKIGEYYTDVNNDDSENIEIYQDSCISITVSCNAIENDLNINTDIKKSSVADLSSLRIDSIQITIDKPKLCQSLSKRLQYKAEIMPFAKIDEIDDLNQKLNSGSNLRFIYTFDNELIEVKELIYITVKINYEFHHEDFTLTKTVTMKRHIRYKAWLSD